MKPKTNVDMDEQTEDGELAVINDESIEPTEIPKITVTLGNDAWIRILTKLVSITLIDSTHCTHHSFIHRIMAASLCLRHILWHLLYYWS